MDNTMKTLKSIYSLFEYLGRARAAGILARSGNIKAAQELIAKTA
jgi:hypothetical protein